MVLKKSQDLSKKDIAKENVSGVVELNGMGI